MAREARDVAREIEEAFQENEYPGDNRLVEGKSLEANEIAQFLRKRTWQHLEIEELKRNYASIFFMTPEALRFYLPAYLRVSVLQYEDSDQIPGSLMFLLRPPPAGSIDEQMRFRTRFDPLTKPQKNAIATFLEFLRDNHAVDFPTGTGNDEASVLLRWWLRAPGDT